MKISNEYVEVKCGKEKVTFRNLILDEYLSILIKTQYDNNEAISYGFGSKYFKRCYLKFDTPLENISPNMSLSDEDFDIYFDGVTITSSNNINNASVLYKFTSEYGYYDIKQDKYIYDYFSEIGGKKITAIGFSTRDDIIQTTNKILAILDTSNYNLTVPIDSPLIISRKDNSVTDAIFNSKDVEFPLHLSPLGLRQIRLFGSQALYSSEYGIIYSVGLGSSAGVMQEEYIVGEDIDIKQIDNFSFKFVLQKATENTYYPNNGIYLSSSKYPTRYNVIKEIYPQNEIMPTSGKYPMQSTYKYIIIKYKCYYVDTNKQMVYSDKEYTMSIYSEKKGLFDVITKIERDGK